MLAPTHVFVSGVFVPLYYYSSIAALCMVAAADRIITLWGINPCYSMGSPSVPSVVRLDDCEVCCATHCSYSLSTSRFGGTVGPLSSP